MSDRWSQDDTPAAVAGEARARSIDAGLRIYMTKVYNYMAMGLLVRPLPLISAQPPAFTLPLPQRR